MNPLLLRKHPCQAATGTAPRLGKAPASGPSQTTALPKRQTPFRLPLEFMYGQAVLTPAFTQTLTLPFTLSSLLPPIELH